MTRQQRLWVGVVILLVAVFLRTFAISNAPPGLQHDEIFKAEEGYRLIEHGQFKLFYPTNQGHEGAYVWLLGLSYLLFGKTLLMIKFPALVCGLLTVAIIYRVGFEAYDDLVAVAAGGLTAVSFWALYVSRVGLRAVMLPLFVASFLWLLYRVCFRDFSKPIRRWRASILAGIVLGGVIYTYTAAPVLYLAYGVFVLFLLVWDHQRFRRLLPHLIVIGGLGLALALPMVFARMNSELGLERASAITEPLMAFQSGNPRPLLDAGRKLAGMFAFTGDPEWRYNVADRPLFLLPVGLLVYLGSAIALLRSRKRPLNVLVLALVVLGMIPSMLTTTPPSYLRSIAMLPSVMLLIGISLAQVDDWLNRRQSRSWMSWMLIFLIVGSTAVADFHAFFFVWPQNEEVITIYRDDLEQLAHSVEASGEPLTAVSTKDTELDPLIMDYIPHPEVAESHLAFFDGTTTIVLSESPALLAVSPQSSISPAHVDWLAPESGTTSAGQIRDQNGAVAYDLYRLNDTRNGVGERLDIAHEWPVLLGPETEFSSLNPADWGTSAWLPINFGDVVELVGVEIPNLTVGPQQGVNLQLYLRPLVTRQEMPINVFVHLMRLDQSIVAQRDLLGAPSRYWHPDMIIMQDTFVPFWEPVKPGQYLLAMGFYNWYDGHRLPVYSEAISEPVHRIILGIVTVTSPEE